MSAFVAPHQRSLTDADALAQRLVSLAAWEVALDVLAEGGVGLGRV